MAKLSAAKAASLVPLDDAELLKIPVALDRRELAVLTLLYGNSRCTRERLHEAAYADKPLGQRPPLKAIEALLSTVQFRLAGKVALHREGDDVWLSDQGKYNISALRSGSALMPEPMPVPAAVAKRARGLVPADFVFKIDEDIPVPPGYVRREEPLFSLWKMQVGNSFFVPAVPATDDVLRRLSNNLRGVVHHFRRKAPLWNFAVRVFEENGVQGIRVWRLEDKKPEQLRGKKK